MRLGIRAIVSALALTLVAPVAADAHPHVFIDAKVTFRFTDTELEGFWVEWAFDEMFTGMLVLDFGIPRNDELTDSHVEEIRRGAFENLRHYDYFTYVVANGERRPVDEVREFDAFFRDHRIVYRFFVPFRKPLSSTATELRVQMYDETFFTDIAFARDNPVKIESAVQLRSDHAIEHNEDRDILYDPTNRSVEREDASYTGVAHPYEIELRFQKR